MTLGFPVNDLSYSNYLGFKSIQGQIFDILISHLLLLVTVLSSPSNGKFYCL